MTDPIDRLLEELADLLALMARVKAMGVGTAGVRQAVLDVVLNIADLVDEEEA